MDSKLFARVAAIALAAVAITLGVLQMREPSPTPPDPAAIDADAAPVDPLRGELRRCQSIGVEAASDRDCLRAWAENRRRFLAPGARPMERIDAPDDTRPDAAEDTAPDDNPLLKQHQSADGAAD